MNSVSSGIEPSRVSAEENLRSAEAKSRPLFKSFWMGGFESACQLNTRGERIDMIEATHHDGLARDDFERVRSVGIQTVRDGVRWHLVETRAGEYDWSSFLPMVRAARDTGVQVIWNLLHYGWPMDVDVLSSAFVDRFAKFCAATMRVIQNETDEIPVFVPANEMSFLAWAMGTRGIIQPVMTGRAHEIKRQLVRTAIAAMDAIWEIEPRARFIHVDPVIHVVAPHGKPEAQEAATMQRNGMFEAWDMVCGRHEPELGGNIKYLDMIGANYYHSNQWEAPDVRMRWEDEVRDERWVPLHRLLDEVAQRYGRPLIISETSHFGVGRGKWLEEIAQEAYIARMQGVPLEGVCLYPIIDRPDWENAAHWHNSGLWDLRMNGEGKFDRVLCDEYFKALQNSQRLLSEVGCT